MTKWSFVKVCPHCGDFIVSPRDSLRICKDDGHEFTLVMKLVPWIAIESLLRGDLLRDELAEQIERIRTPKE